MASNTRVEFEKVRMARCLLSQFEDQTPWVDSKLRVFSLLVIARWHLAENIHRDSSKKVQIFCIILTYGLTNRIPRAVHPLQVMPIGAGREIGTTHDSVRVDSSKNL